MSSLLLSLLLSYWPSTRAHAPLVRETAEAIEAATSLPSERAALATVALFETTLGRRGVPFGASCCARGRPARAVAPEALAILRQGLSRCRSWLGAFAHYHTGRCTPGRYERAERRVHADLTGALGMLSVRPRW